MFLFKPYRRINENVTLTKEHCSYNDLRGVETSIYLDLNVLSKIRKVMLGEDKFSEELLKAFEKIKTLNVFLSPGLALDEVKHDLLLPTIEQFENFCVQLGVSNAYDWIPYDYNKNKKIVSSFFDLHSDQKIGLMTIYNSILNIHYICQKYEDETDQNKFRLYVDSMLANTDVLDALGCTIASYCFVRDCKADLLKKIKENFLKLRDKRPVILKSLNAARDVQFIRTLAFREYYSYIDGKTPMDCWCMTADQGLKAFSDFIFYVKLNLLDGCVCIETPDELSMSEDWNNNFSYLTEKANQRILLNLAPSSESDREAKIAKVEKSIDRLERYFKFSKKSNRVFQ